jgi:transposase-like protein
VGKPKRKFSDEVKYKAVADYLAGDKSAVQVAAELGVSVNNIYNWRVQLDEKAKEASIEELEATGRSREDALLILQLQAERDAYQKMVGEQAVMLELLKKRLLSTTSQRRSELTGLIEILEKSVQKRKRGLR